MDELRGLASRVVMGAFAGPELPGWMHDLLAGGLGSICIFGSNVESPEQLTALTNAIHQAGRDVIITADEEGGDVTRLHMRTGNPFPGNAALGSADDVVLTEQVARSIGSSLRDVGIDMDLAPVVDVNSNPHNPVIGVRSFGAGPDLVARHTEAYVRGMQSSGVAACVKHWPGHGDTSVDSHVGLPTVDAPLEVLRARELVPFVAAVSAGTAAVMTSHVILPALDTALPATLSTAIVDLLRDDLGFDGLLVSDALDMKGASSERGVPAAAVLALKAGVDLLCVGADKDASDHEGILEAIVAAVESGELPRQRLEQAAQRCLTASRLVRAWADEPRVAALPGADERATADAARGALRVRGVLPPASAVVALRFLTGANIAAGEVPWGLPHDAPVLAGGRQFDVVEGTSVGELLTSVADSRVVALVREAHRWPWVADLLRRLAEARPDLVVVEMGWPGPHGTPGAAQISSFGASRANAAAVAELLTIGSQA